jgi:hypothetical protein
MNTFERLQQQRARLLEIARQHGAHHVRIFGSVVRGEDQPGSDVDFLVEMDRGRTLLDLVGLQQALTNYLGREVDVITETGINRYLKDRILAEAREL